MRIELDIDPSMDPCTFDFAGAEAAFEAVQRETTAWADHFDAVEVHAFLLDLHQHAEEAWLAGRAFELLAHMPPPGGLPFLTKLLASGEVEWRCAACRMLAEHPGDPASALLAKVLLSDEDPDVRWWAATALETVGTANALPALRHATLHDEGRDYEGFRVADAAQQALEALRSRA